MDVGYLIKIRRKSLRLNQERFGLRIGRSACYVSRLENDFYTRQKLTLENIWDICRVLNLDPTVFLLEKPSYININLQK